MNLYVIEALCDQHRRELLRAAGGRRHDRCSPNQVRDRGWSIRFSRRADGGVVPWFPRIRHGERLWPGGARRESLSASPPATWA